VAADSWLDSSTISASNRSSGRETTGTTGGGGTSARVIVIRPNNHPGTTKTVAIVDIHMTLTVVLLTDIPEDRLLEIRAVLDAAFADRFTNDD
jgi:hypothetical protein